MAISLVNQTFVDTVSGGGSPNKNITIPTPAAGNGLVLFVGNVSGAALVGVSGGGVTWALIGSFIDPTTTARVGVWAGFDSTGIGSTVTVTRVNAYGSDAVNITEWSGLGATPTTDGSGAGTTRPNVLTPTITPTAGSECLLMAGCTVFTSTVTAGPSGGFTGLTGSSPAYQGYAYRIVPSASGSYQCGWTSAAAYGQAGAGIYSLTPSGGTGGGGSNAYRRPAMYQGMGPLGIGSGLSL